MAITANAVWEMRTTGSNTNGGFYKSDAGTTDYSQQNTAQLSLTDIVADGTNTLISAIGGYTAAMVGNGIYLDNITGWREITVVTDTNTITVDATVTAGTGITGNVGGAIAVETDYLADTVWLAGHTIHRKSGTYTLTESISVLGGGTMGLPIRMYGYDVTRGDEPRGTNRPLIAIGTFNFTYGAYFRFYHMRATHSTLYGWKADSQASWTNCKVTCNGSADSGFTSTPGNTYQNSWLFDCEVDSTGTNNVGITCNVTSIRNCYFHDIERGVNLLNLMYGYSIEWNIFDTVSSASYSYGAIDYASVNSNTNVYIGNNIFYNCYNGIRNNTVNNPMHVRNNIFKDCTNSGILVDQAQYGELDYNNWHGNGTDIKGEYGGTPIMVKGTNATAVDPAFTDAANGDFTSSVMQSTGQPSLFAGDLFTTYVPQGAYIAESGGGGGAVQRSWGY